MGLEDSLEGGGEWDSRVLILEYLVSALFKEREIGQRIIQNSIFN